MGLNTNYNKDKWRFIAKEQSEGVSGLENHLENKSGVGEILLSSPNQSIDIKHQKDLG